MWTAWLYTLVSVGLVSTASLVGLAALALGEKVLRRATPLMVSLAVGAMLGDAFIHLLPEAFARSSGSLAPSLAVLGGMLFFFVLEKFLHWKHEHTPSRVSAFGYMDLVADGLHNLVDGALIGASYLAGVPAGVATTVAVLLHELPQEAGDFGILIQAGFRKSTALLLNLASACVAFAGAVLVLLVGQSLAGLTDLVGPMTGGGFIYLAAADLIPELHRERSSRTSILQLLAIVLGIGLMLLLTRLEPFSPAGASLPSGAGSLR